MRGLIAIFFLLLSHVVIAQSNSLAVARGLLAGNNYEKAKPLLNEAARDIRYSGNAETWFLRGLCYLMQATDINRSNADEAEEAYTSFVKALSLKPDYNAEINYPLYGIAIIKFNQAVAAYSAAQYDKAYRGFMSVDQIFQPGKADRFSDNIEFIQLAAESRKNAAYAAINAGHDNDARPLLEELVKQEGKEDLGIYQSLIEIYQASRNSELQIATIRAAQRQFPESEIFKQMEADYNTALKRNK